MNKTKKLLLTITMSGLALVGVAKEYTVGLAVANLQADFFNQIKQSVVKEGKKLGVKIVTVDARGDSATQVSQIQDLITQKVDAIIYIPAGATAASVPVDAAHKAGIPVIAVDRNPEGTPGDTFIATDSVAAARELGEWVAKETGGKGNIAIVQGQIGTTPEIDRNKGFNEAIEKYPELKEVARQASKMWMQDEGFNIAKDLIQRNPEINVIFGRADALALGAAQAVRVSNVKHDVLVVGFDGDMAGLEGILQGKLAATMVQRTQHMGRLALQSALKLADGEDVPAMQLQGATLATKENAKGFLENHP